MKLYKTLLAALALLASATVVSCSDDFDRPPVIVPEATIEANTTILELKQMYWQTNPATDYLPTVGKKDNGENVVIEGVVVSNDSLGNIYQRIILQDETSAITVRIYSQDLYEKYHYGQRVVIDVTGMRMGYYGNLLMIGVEYNGSIGGLSIDDFPGQIQVDGLPEKGNVHAYTTTISDLNQYKGIQDSLMVWQTRLVRLENVSFVGAGSKTFGTVGASNYTTTYLKDEAGNQLPISTSNKCDFPGLILPEGTGTVTAILSYYRNDWQLVFSNPEADCEGFTWVESPAGPDAPGAFTGNGTSDSPFTVSDVLNGATASGNAFVKGFIVGWVDGQKIAEGATFTTPASSASNILLADKPDEKNVANCIPVQLVAQSAIRAAVNLKDNPQNLGKSLKLEGALEKYFGVAGVKAPTDNYTLDGADAPVVPDTPTGDAIYSGLAEGAASIDWTFNDVKLGEGMTYVWSWKEYNGKHYLNASGYMSNAAQTCEAWAVSPAIDLTGKTKVSVSFDHAAKFQTTLRTFCGFYVREAGKTDWTKLEIPTWPEAGAWTFVNSGAISLDAFAGKKIELAFKYESNSSGADTWEIKNLKVY